MHHGESPIIGVNAFLVKLAAGMATGSPAGMCRIELDDGSHLR
jgi:hypothetical protein